MGLCPLVVSHSVPMGSQPYMLLQCPSKRAAWKKHSERIGCHLLECKVFIQSETPMWCYVPSRKGTRDKE